MNLKKEIASLKKENAELKGHWIRCGSASEFWEQEARSTRLYANALGNAAAAAHQFLEAGDKDAAILILSAIQAAESRFDFEEQCLPVPSPSTSREDGNG